MVCIGEVTHRTASVAIMHPEESHADEWGAQYFIKSEAGDIHHSIIHNQNAYFQDLKPGTHYELYEVKMHFDLPLDSIATANFTTLSDWQFKEPAPNFSFVAGSCSYINEEITDRPGTPYGNHYQIYRHMAEDTADFNLWLGDNLYLRPSDYTSSSGIERRYKYSRGNEELAQVLASRPNLAIWDDHDAGPNNCLGSFHLIDETRSCFRRYWPREKYGTSEANDLRWVSEFSDVVFIGLDNRSYRTSEHSANPQILGKEQIDWMVSQIHSNQNASFIVVAIGGQVLNSEALYENYAQYPAERAYLLSHIKSTGYKNLVFFTGDRHHSERSEVNMDDIRIVDFTVSPMTSGPSDVVHDEENTNRVGGYIDERNYALVSVTGSSDERMMTVTYKNKDGQEIFKHEIKSL